MIRREAVTIAIALAVSLLLGSLLVLLFGESPLEVFSLLMSETWGQAYGLGQVLYNATALVLTGLAVALAFRVGLFNIGAEGQMIAGAFATALCGAALPHTTPALVALPLCIAAGMLAGGSIGAVPGWLKARYGAHEVINTIMLNFITASLVLWLGNRFFFVEGTVRTGEIIPGARLSSLDAFPGSTANSSVFLALFLALAMYLFLSRTRRGYEWRAVGHNLRAAENSGIDVKTTVIAAMAASGALAGAVGANFVMGDKFFFENGYGKGFGFMGIAVALLGRNHPLGIVAAALLFGTLSEGGLAVSELVPKDLVDILQAVVILAVAAAAAYMYTRQRQSGREPAAQPPAEPAAAGGATRDG